MGHTSQYDALMNRKILAHIVLPAAVIGALVAYLLIVRDRLPEQVATHWSGPGAPDGFTSRDSVVVLFPAITLIVTGLLVAVSRLATPSIAGAAAVGGLPLAMAGFLSALTVVTTTVQIDSTTPPNLPGWSIPVAMAVGLLGLLVGGMVHGSPPPPPDSTSPGPDGAPRYPLAESGTAVWSGSTPTAQIPIIMAIGVGALGAGLAAAVSPWLLLIFLPLVALLAGSSSFAVTIGPAGLRVAARMLGWPRVRIPLRHVASASEGSVDAMSFGGWGIRVGMNKETAVITRSGPALVVSRTDGAVLRVSMEQPEEPAAVLTSLLDRRQ